jgi:hypothetical protein
MIDANTSLEIIAFFSGVSCAALVAIGIILGEILDLIRKGAK